MLTDTARWFERRTSSAADWPVGRLLAAKESTTVSVVLPALNEDRTVGDIVAAIRRDLVEAWPLVDDLVVIDSGSSDDTIKAAHDAGARVVRRDEILPGLPTLPGKGEVLWRSLLATKGDVICFVDADLREFSSSFVTGLLGPILTDPSVELVKGMYDRPLEAGQQVLPAGGGRVTELVARPLLNLHWPELAGVVQPLAGEYAGRRRLLERLPFASGYGVEIGILIDALELAGLDALAQVDLGVRKHRHQDDASLGRMASEIVQVAMDRLARYQLAREGGLSLSPRNRAIAQFERGPDGFLIQTFDVAVTERPPMSSLWEYARERAGAQ
ncbi:MAG: glucosyl-3-phosphoglycerate synthase [Carbonactinosporaceae bacterium]